MWHWTFWEWVGYSTLWVSAIIVAMDGGLKMAPQLASGLPRPFSFLRSPVWAFAPLAFLMIGTVSLIIHDFVPNGVGNSASMARLQPLPVEFRVAADPIKLTTILGTRGRSRQLGFFTTRAGSYGIKS